MFFKKNNVNKSLGNKLPLNLSIDENIHKNLIQNNDFSNFLINKTNRKLINEMVPILENSVIKFFKYQ